MLLLLSFFQLIHSPHTQNTENTKNKQYASAFCCYKHLIKFEAFSSLSTFEPLVVYRFNWARTLKFLIIIANRNGPNTIISSSASQVCCIKHIQKLDNFMKSFKKMMRLIFVSCVHHYQKNFVLYVMWKILIIVIFVH